MVHPFDDFFDRLAGLANQIDALFHLPRAGGDERFDLCRGVSRSLGKATDLRRDDRKATTRFTGASGFNACVESQQIGLERDVVNHTNDPRDLGRGFFDVPHRADSGANDFPAALGLCAGFVHCLFNVFCAFSR